MRQLSLLGAISTLLVLAGCTLVYSTHPLGEAPLAVQAEDWEGTWYNPGGSLTIMIEDHEKGILQAAWVEESDGELAFKSFQVLLLESDEWIFCNIKEPESNRYLWGRIKRADNQILVWMPEASELAALVEADKLPGTVEEDGDVILPQLTSEQLQVITSGEHCALLDWSDPVVLFRLSE
jgi:hypothetical protein